MIEQASMPKPDTIIPLSEKELKLVEENFGLVYSAASQIYRLIYPNFFDLEDVTQIGMLGLIAAAQGYDPQKGKFSTYAGTCIRRMIWRTIGNESQLIVIPIHVQKTLRNQQKGININNHNVLKEIAKTTKTIVHVFLPIVYLDQLFVSSDETISWEKLLPRYELTPEQYYISCEFLQYLPKILCPQEIKILLTRAKLLGTKDHTLINTNAHTFKEIGKKFGLSHTTIWNMMLEITTKLSQSPLMESIIPKLKIKS